MRRRWFPVASAAGAVEDRWWERAERSGWGRGGIGFSVSSAAGAAED